jgi:hypothetical protein
MRKLRVRLLGSLFLLSCTVVQSSCFSSWEIEASFDASKEGEKGPSGETATYAPNFNAFIEDVDFFTGDFLIYDDNNPDIRASADYLMPYQPATTNKSGFGLATSGGYIGKGAKKGAITEHLNYLEASEALVYGTQSTSGTLYAGLGPYIAYGLGGKVKFNGGSEPLFGSDGYKRFDAGIHFVGGYRLRSGWSVGVGYDWGLYDKSNDPSDYTSRNRTFSVSVGYSVEKIVKAIKGKK